MTESNGNEQAAKLTALVKNYLDDAYRCHPSLAAYAGVHRYDTELDDLSADARADEHARLHDYRRRLHEIERAQLDVGARVDWQMVDNNINTRLLELNELRSFASNPLVYTETLSQALLRQALFDYAPAASRLADITARLEKVPRLAQQARENLDNPAPILVDVGLNSLHGAISLIEKDLPAAFTQAGDERLRARYQSATEAALAALNRLVAYLDNDLRAHAEGDFALGEKLFQMRLGYEEGITMPLAKLLELAERELAATQEQFHATARLADAQCAPLETWRRIQQQHAPAGELVRAAQGQLDEILQFLAARKIVSWPAAEPAQVAPTPEFFRWSFASMVSPGPLERCSLPSRYFITDADPSWPPEQQEAHLTYFSDPILWAISVHEVYPGHFVQFAHLKAVRSMVRQNPVFMPVTYVEGWAHYTEQMMFEEGFLAGQPVMRLGQLWEALLRLCRFVVSIKLHTREMDVEAATKFFVDNAYAEEVPSRSEAERGCFDPMYLCYSLGKLEILRLREDCRRAQGNNFSLHQFHEKLLSEGMAPIAYHREMMLGN